MAERIKELRKALGLSQESFAESIDLTKNYISLVETEKRTLADRTVRDLCRIYNVNEEWLRTGNGEMFAPKDRESEIADITARMFNGKESDYRYQLQRLISECDEQALEIVYELAKKWVENTKEAQEKELPD